MNYLHADAVPELEEEASDFDVSLLHRQARKRKRAAAIAIVTTCLALLAATMLVRNNAKRSVDRNWAKTASGFVQEYGSCADEFQQCDGSDFTGAKCCKAGCVCVKKNKYYSACKPATKEGGCDPTAAQHKADLIMHNAIRWQAKATQDAKRKADAAEKVAVVAERMAKLERAAAELYAAEARQARKAVAAIEAGNGAKWYPESFSQGGIAKKAKEKADAAGEEASKLDSLESTREMVTTELFTALTKTGRFAAAEKPWADNLGEDADWKRIPTNFKPVPQEKLHKVSASADSDDEGDVVYEPSPTKKEEKASSGGGDSKLVGGVYFTR